MGNILFNDPTNCLTSAEITSVVLSSSGPWGLDTATGVLTIPTTSELLRGQPQWIYNATTKVNELVFYRMDNSDICKFQARLSPFASSTEKANSFENNGVGLEIIHSKEVGGTRPANPNLIPNSAGTTNRKYRQSQYYIWFEDPVGRPTHWWSPIDLRWWQIRPLRNTLTVGPNQSFDFTSLEAAISYITTLPVTAATRDPNQDALQSSTNIWNIVMWGQTIVTTTISAPDYINVLFMPGSQIITSSSSHPGATMILFDGSTRADGKIRATWTSLNSHAGQSVSTSGSPYDQTETRSYNIIHTANDSTSNFTAVLISDVKSMVLNDISIAVDTSGYDPDTMAAIRVTGDCSESAALTAARQGVHFNRVNASVVPRNTLTTTELTGFSFEHTAGACYMDDCQVTAQKYLEEAGQNICVRLLNTGSSVVEMNECRIQAATYVNAALNNTNMSVGIRSYNINTTGKLIVVRSDIEAYGSTTAAQGASGLFHAGGDAICALSRFSVVQSFFGADPVSTPSACVRTGVMSSAYTLRLDSCVLRTTASASNSSALRVSGASNTHAAKLVVNQCVIVSPRYSIDLAGATLTNSQFYGNHIEGPISGSFGALAATTTYNTSFLV